MIEIRNNINCLYGNRNYSDKIKRMIIDELKYIATFPYSVNIYRFTKIIKIKFEYRRVDVLNYCIFYFIDEINKKIYIARILNSKRDIDNII